MDIKDNKFSADLPLSHTEAVMWSWNRSLCSGLFCAGWSSSCVNLQCSFYFPWHLPIVSLLYHLFLCLSHYCAGHYPRPGSGAERQFSWDHHGAVQTASLLWCLVPAQCYDGKTCGVHLAHIVHRLLLRCSNPQLIMITVPAYCCDCKTCIHLPDIVHRLLFKQFHTACCDAGPLHNAKMARRRQWFMDW